PVRRLGRRQFGDQWPGSDHGGEPAGAAAGRPGFRAVGRLTAAGRRPARPGRRLRWILSTMPAATWRQRTLSPGSGHHPHEGRVGVAMCRSIRTLFNFEPPATSDEIQAASLQFVRKLSGFTKPSRANEAAFNAAVDEIARVAAELLTTLEATAAPKNREEEAA